MSQKSISIEANPASRQSKKSIAGKAASLVHKADGFSYWFSVIFLLVNIALVLAVLVALSFKDVFGVIEIHEACLLILFFDALLLAIKRDGPFGIVPMMLYMFFLFLLSNVLFDFVGLSSMRYSRVHLGYRISEETLLTLLVIYEIFLLAVILFVTLFKRREPIIRLRHNETLERYSTIGIFVLGAPAIFEYVHRAVVYSAMTTAYTASYIDDGSTSVLSICIMLFKALIPLYLASMPKGRLRGWCFATIVIFILASMFGGSRSTGLIPLCFLIWYYVNTGHKIPIGKVVAVLLALFVVFTLATGFRGSASSWNVVEQINSDNVSFAMSANAIDYQDELVNPRANTYFLSNFLNPIMRYVVARDAFTGGRGYEYASASFSLDDKVMYAIAPDAFAAGRGFGSSSVLEFYLFAGIPGVAIMSFLYLWGTGFFERKAFRSTIFFVLFYWWFQAFVFSARASALPSSFYLLLSFVFLFAISLLYKRRLGVKLSDHVGDTRFGLPTGSLR